MKSIKILNSFILLFLLAFSLGSCEKWIDVAPRTQIEESRFFKTQLGYQEALAGSYLQMLGTSLYGRELTFGFLDAIGRTYEIETNQGGQYLEAYNGTYRNDGLISSIYGGMYNIIANLNNIIIHLETADQRIFSEGEYNRLKGEALGLRAFLHFDLVRMYTKSYENDGENSIGIPYVTTYEATISPRIAVKDAMEKLLDDLTAAEKLLENEPLVKGLDDSRKQFFNYYAVKATKARAYMWMQDRTNALKEAEQIIAIAPARFPFVTQTAIAASDPNKNRVFSTEHLFGLTAEQLSTNYVGYLDTTRLGAPLVIGAVRKQEMYEGIITDYRSQYLLKDLTTSSDPLLTAAMKRVYFSKLHQPAASNRMPLIKIPEMYYIAAECLSQSDPAKAIGYLNLVRQARGIASLLNPNSSSAEVMEQVQKEYVKEMPCEGQMFFFYKRQNSTTVPKYVGTFPATRYLLPLPQQEIDFGY